MKDGFLHAAAVSPGLRVADVPYNKAEILAAMQKAAAEGVKLLCLPELCLTGYTCGDLFLQQPLLRAAEDALAEILQASAGLDLVALVGLPVRVDAKLYNCAAVLCRGKLLGLVPKTHLPNYAEFYELRHFAPAPQGVRSIALAGQEAPFGASLLFRCRQMPSFVLGVELCEDLAGRRDGDCEPFGQRRDDRQGRLPPRPCDRAERAAALCLSVRRRRPRREHNRYDLCRPQPDCRKRRAAG